MLFLFDVIEGICRLLVVDQIRPKFMHFQPLRQLLATSSFIIEVPSNIKEDEIFLVGSST
jgi:hypothetical protein